MKVHVRAGERFGRLVAERATKVGKLEMWLCRCDCGNVAVISKYDLKRANRGRESCGCIRTEKTIARSLKHGQDRRSARTREYGVWRAMWTRCTNPNSRDWPRYGGRGIQICDRWKSFELFFADMGKRPSAAHSIDRINNDGNYEPSNCRWATAREQRANRGDS